MQKCATLYNPLFPFVRPLEKKAAPGKGKRPFALSRGVSVPHQIASMEPRLCRRSSIHSSISDSSHATHCLFPVAAKPLLASCLAKPDSLWELACLLQARDMLRRVFDEPRQLTLVDQLLMVLHRISPVKRSIAMPQLSMLTEPNGHL